MKIASKLLISLVVFLLQNCHILDSPPLPKETRELEGQYTREEAQKAMSKALYEFYSNSDKSYEFYEVKWQTYFLLNYNPTLKTLNVSIDICSGWVAQYIDVSEDDLQALSEARYGFDNYPDLLSLQTESKGIIKTNGCMGYPGKK